MLESLGVSTKREDVEAMVKVADTDGNGADGAAQLVFTSDG